MRESRVGNNDQSTLLSEGNLVFSDDAASELCEEEISALRTSSDVSYTDSEQAIQIVREQMSKLHESS